jgi:recombination protein U
VIKCHSSGLFEFQGVKQERKLQEHMGTWNSRGLRGSTLEDLINRSNDCYREKGLALIQKIPTPITPIEIDKTSRHITLAYFDQKSTVDYIGAVQGIPVCFDAKECSVTTFPLQNLHPHQVRFMKEFEKQGGIAFLILYYTGLDEIYYMPFQDVSRFWKRMEDGGRKSFTYEEVDKSWQIRSHRDILVHYLEQIARDLQLREA